MLLFFSVFCVYIDNMVFEMLFEIVCFVVNFQVLELRSGYRCVVDDGNMYVFGGYFLYNENFFYCELWCFNIVIKIWYCVNIIGFFLNEVVLSCFVYDKGNFIVFGGFGVFFGESNSKRFYVCFLRRYQWFDFMKIYFDKEESDGEGVLLIVGYGQSMVLFRDKELYVFGGIMGLEFNLYLYCYSFFNYIWEYVKSYNFFVF